jgi:hypothetical protein
VKQDHTAQCHISEDSTLNIYCYEDLRFNAEFIVKMETINIYL